MMRATIALLVLSIASCAEIAAQQPAPNPAPIAEGKSVWTADESLAFAYAQKLVSAWREGRECKWSRSQVVDLPSYSVSRVEWRDGEAVVLGEQYWSQMFRPGRCLVYIAPRDSDSSSRRAFCVRGDGVAAFTDNSERRTMLGDEQFPPDAVFGAGGEVVLTAFPRMPSRGRDGNFWQPVSMLRTTSVNIMVVDDEGEPMSMRSLVCLPCAPDYAIDHAIPAGAFLTTIEGDAKLSGVPARGLGFALENTDRSRFWISSKCVSVRGRSIRITVPREVLRTQRINANESAAIATLKNICSGQQQCQASGVIDSDQDGRGEFGVFAELSGGAQIRGSKLHITPPVLSAAFRRVEKGVVTRSGYHFRIFLAGKDAAPVPEAATGGIALAAIDAAQCEKHWCCYAWPVEAGETGKRTFFISEVGQVLTMKNIRGTYSGRAKAPSGNAARKGEGGLAAPTAAGRLGEDKRTWQPIK